MHRLLQITDAFDVAPDAEMRSMYGWWLQKLQNAQCISQPSFPPTPPFFGEVELTVLE